MLQKLFTEFGATIQRNPGVSLLDLDVDWVRSQLREQRAILLRGFSVDLSQFKKFTDQFSCQFLKHFNPNSRPRLSDDATITGVVAGSQRVNLHGEMYYFPFRPDILFLHCTQPSLDGGETTVCDPVQLFHGLQDKTRALFQSRRIRYIHCMNERQLFEAWGWTSLEQGVAEIGKLNFTRVALDSEAHLVRFEFATSAVLDSRFGPAFLNSIVNTTYTTQKVNKSRVVFEDGEPIGDDLIREIDEVGEASSHLVHWQAGDVLMIDNFTLLHGRRPFVGNRKIATRFSLGAIQRPKDGEGGTRCMA